jgi:hypothetical protein
MPALSGLYRRIASADCFSLLRQRFVAKSRGVKCQILLTYAVVDGDDGLLPDLRQHAHHHGDADQRRAHPGAFRVAQAVQVGRVDAGLVQRLGGWHFALT